jgi:hypothetical protein
MHLHHFGTNLKYSVALGTGLLFSYPFTNSHFPFLVSCSRAGVAEIFIEKTATVRVSSERSAGLRCHAEARKDVWAA